MGRAFVGTSGWVYPHWQRIFYPPGQPLGRRLAYLAERFPTVEVNGSFYRLQRPDCFARWRADVPDDFTFAIKASRYITHMLKLGGGPAPMANFFAQGLLVLGEKLGPILWQLPPGLRFTPDRARPFLQGLPRDVGEAEWLAKRHDRRLTGRSVLTAPDGRDRPLLHALEVRDPSWLSDESLELLIRHGVALVTADTAGRFPFTLTRTAASFTYVRLHGARRLYGSSYTADELDWWARMIGAWCDDGADVYVYFDNDNKAYAPGNALGLMDRLGQASGGRTGIVRPADTTAVLPP